MGTTYKPPSLVFVKFEYGIPIFGEIIEILSHENVFYLTLQMFYTSTFNSHYHAYQVEKTNIFTVLKPDSLVDHHPLWLYQSQLTQLINTCFVPLKYYVLNKDDY